jgi:hypothetical protein
MRRITALRLAGAALMTLTAAATALTAPAAHASPAAGAARTAAPAGLTDPCPPSGPDNVGCASLIPATGPSPAVPASGPPAGTLGPADLQKAYDIQGATAGSGQTAAVVTPYGDPAAASDLAAYRSQYALTPCTVANGCFRQVNEKGTTTGLPGYTAGWDVGISESLDAISAVCPSCHILLVEATTSDITADLGPAEDEAVALGAKFIVNDWGGSEATSESTTFDPYFNHPGVAITAPAGNGGYPSAWYPAASQYVTAVGGTALTADSSSSRGFDEAAWSLTGSGCSADEPKPTWQVDTECSTRTLNDLSAAATNVAFYDTNTEGGWGDGSGTAISAAIITAAYADAGTPGASDYPAEYPYEHPGGTYTTPGNAYPYSDGLYDITSGSNGTCSAYQAYPNAQYYQCTAGPGYDAPTGLGSPAGPLALTSAGGEPGVIFNGIADKCLDDAGAATTTHTHIQISSCNGAASQDWTVEPDGTVRFDSSYCMADSGVATTGGFHLIDLEPCSTTSPAMQWQPRSNSSLYNPATGWCLADPGSSTVDGTQLIDGTCNGSASQQWTIPYTRPAYPGAIQSKLTTAKMCITDAGASTANGNPIEISACVSDAAQDNWTVEPDGTLQFSGHCLVPQNAGTADGTLIVLWTCQGEASQFWTERADGTFVNKTSGTCLDDTGSSITNGTQLTLLHCITSPNEGWTPHGET